MSKSNHTGTGDAPQNQNNAMSDDPGDGNRTSFTTDSDTPDKVPGPPDDQGEDRLRELGEQG